MKYAGGPRDGEDVEPEHQQADEITVTRSEYDASMTPLGMSVHLYLPDAFGRMSYRGVVQ